MLNSFRLSRWTTRAVLQSRTACSSPLATSLPCTCLSSELPRAARGSSRLNRRRDDVIRDSRTPHFCAYFCPSGSVMIQPRPKWVSVQRSISQAEAVKPEKYLNLHSKRVFINAAIVFCGTQTMVRAQASFFLSFKFSSFLSLFLSSNTFENVKPRFCGCF